MYLESHRARVQALTGHACCGCEQSLNSKFRPRSSLILLDSRDWFTTAHCAPSLDHYLNFIGRLSHFASGHNDCDLDFAARP
jgi:hypothetical protein